MHDVRPRVVRCRDTFDRDGQCTVIVRDREVVLTSPPGEAARLTIGQLSELIHALREARDELFGRE